MAGASDDDQHEGEARGGASESFTDRGNLIAYLQYAVDDVAAINKTSGAFLQMAITHLEHSGSLLPVFDGVHKLS